jgi:hypothetical protein
MIRNAKKHSEPPHGHIDSLFVRMYDRNIKDFILVPLQPNAGLFCRLLNALFGESREAR